MKKNIGMPLLLMFVFALSRWPGAMPANFSAAYAIMFCAGLYFPGRMAWYAPLSTLLVSDILINLFAYPGTTMSFWEYAAMMAPNYVGYVVVLILGRGLQGRRSWLTLTGGGLLGAFLFFVITCTASWITLPYAKTFLGWIQALTTGLPNFPMTWEFFRNSLLSGGLFTGLFVGAIKLLEPAESAEEKREPAEQAEPESESEPEEASA